MPLEAVFDAFAAALTDPAAPPPAGTRGALDIPDARRFAVYRNNVAVGLIGALEARYPVVRRLVGEAFFRAAARAFLAAHRPRSAVLIAWGGDFPAFLRDFPPAADPPYLADVAALENAWVEAYHSAEAAPLALDALAQVSPDRLDGLRFVVHPAARLVLMRRPGATIWAAHQHEGDPAAVDRAGPEDALVTRPHADVLVRVLPPGGAALYDALARGEPLALAAAPLIEAGADPGAHIVGLVSAGAFMALA